MDKELLVSKEIKKYFIDKNYNCVKPHSLTSNNDTVFITAGIQSLISDFEKLKLEKTNKIYIAQPVIRTQFMDSISEGSSIAFVNLTSAGFNITEEEHKLLIKDWMDLFHSIGINESSISTQSKEYYRKWGDLSVGGKKEFYYCNDIEIGDTTFFQKVQKDGKSIGIETMSDVGFGLERIRWILNQKSYFDLYSDSASIRTEIKAYLSALALLTVNSVKPSNKNAGYRVRLFSKKLVNLLNGNYFLGEAEKKYFNECIIYWKDWQEKNEQIKIEQIKKEHIRNCNRYVIDKLVSEGYKNIQGININISREEMEKRLISSNIDFEKVKKLMR